MSSSSSSSPYDRSQSKRRRNEESGHASRHVHLAPWAHRNEQGESRQTYEHNTVRDQGRAHYGNVFEGSVVQNFHGRHTPEAQENDEPLLMAALRFDQMEDRHASISKAHSKTCRWLLTRKEFNDWRDLDQLGRHHGFLWIKGKPGAGKSTMMKYVLDHDSQNRNQETKISFFFNARGHPLERSVEGMYRSLILQLLEAVPRLQSVLTHRHSHLREGSILSVEFLKEVFIHLVSNLREDRLSCYIDALDECDVNQIRDDMVYFFRDLAERTVSNNTQFFVCFSSRHYPHVSIEKCIEITLEDQDEHERDIADYIKQVLRIGQSKISQRIRDLVQSKAAGVFLWVVLVTSMLNKEYDRGRIHELQRRVQEIPAGLSELFQEILTRGSPSEDEVADEVLLALEWIAFARRPLRSNELYYGIRSGVDPKLVETPLPSELSREDMIRYIVDCSRGLAKPTKGKEPVIQFIHETVKEYLVGKSGLAQLDHATTGNLEGHGHNLVKGCCEHYIGSIPATYQALNVPVPKAKSDEAKQLRQSMCSDFPLLEYAVAHVLYHADTAQALGISQESFVQHFPFLGPPDSLKDWVHLNNLLEKYEIRRYDDCKKYIFADRRVDNLTRLAFAEDPMPTKGSNRYRTPLRAAISNQSYSTIMLLLDQPEYQHLPRDAFQFAISEKLPDLLSALAEDRPYWPDPVELLNITHLALQKDNQDVIKYMLDKGKIELNLEFTRSAEAGGEDTKQTLLFRALELKSPAVCAHLVKRGARVALNWASMESAGTKGLAKNALSLSALRDISLPGPFLKDLLCIASSGGDLEVVLSLLSKHACFDSRTEASSMTALGAASRGGHVDVVRVLLSRGADVNASRCDRKPLAEAIDRGESLVVQALLEAKASVNDFSRLSEAVYSGNAFYVACRRGDTQVALLLLDNGLEIHSWCNSRGELPLTVASTCGQPNVVKALLERGAEVFPRMYKTILLPGLRSEIAPDTVAKFEKVVELLWEAEISQSSAESSTTSNSLESGDRPLARGPGKQSIAWVLS